LSGRWRLSAQITKFKQCTITVLLGVDQAPITRWGIDPAETLAGMSLAVASLTNSDRRDRHSYSF
jgi:hypothetical protein